MFVHYMIFTYDTFSKYTAWICYESDSVSVASEDIVSEWCIQSSDS